MRALFALLVAHHIPAWLPYNSLPAPNGLAVLVDLSVLLNPAVFAVCRYILYAALALYVLRIGWSFVLPYMTLLSIAVGSITNSQGAIGHSMQVVALVLLAQTAAHFYSLFRARGSDRAPSEADGEGRMIRWSQQAFAATYLASGVTKVIRSSGEWIWQSPFAALQVIKTNEQRFHDLLDPAAVGAGAAVAEWMLQHPFLVGSAMTAGLLLELSAPLLLLGRGWAAFYGLALVAFHESIHRVMNLQFVYNEALAWIYLVNVPFWLALVAGWIRRRGHPEQGY